MELVSAESILKRRIVIVTGKGGTGKSSVAASLAFAAAAQGLRVLVAEMGLGEQIPRLFQPQAKEVGYKGAEIHPGVQAMRIDPYEALAEYLSLQIGVGTLVRGVLRQAAFRQLMDASPGWRELITLGKVWHLEQMKEANKRPRFDLLIVDAPATGHGLALLDVPSVVISAVRSGPLRRHSEWVEALVRDPERSVLLPVALPEELPARETAELIEHLEREKLIAIDRIIVNAVPSNPIPGELGDIESDLEALLAHDKLPGLPSANTLVACVRHLRSRYQLAQHYLECIARWTGCNVIPLPFRPNGVNDVGDLAILANALMKPDVGGKGVNL